MLAAAALSVVSAALAAPAPLTGSIRLVDKGWVCSGPVDLDSVSVTMTQNAQGPLRGSGNVDAVHIHSGCTGRIGRLDVVQYLGDGIKVGQGAHDLEIGGGSVRCYGRAPGKHQDGVQVMGGSTIVFHGLDVQCPTANNAAFFVNQGTNSNEAPTGVVCDGCVLSGGGITVRIYGSVDSGVRNSTIVAGHISPLRISKDSAIRPVNVANVVLPTGSTPTAPVAPAAPVLRSVRAARATVAGTVATVRGTFAIDRSASVVVSVVGPAGVPVPLLAGSSVGAVRSGRPHVAIPVRSTGARPLPVALRISAARLVPRRTYRVRIVATTPEGTRTSLMLPFVRG